MSKKINIDVVFNAIDNIGNKINGYATQLTNVGACMWKLNQVGELWGKTAESVSKLSAGGMALENSMAELSAINGIAGEAGRVIQTLAKDFKYGAANIAKKITI